MAFKGFFRLSYVSFIYSRRVRAAIPTKPESAAGRVGPVHDFGAGRVNQNGSDVLELLYRKFAEIHNDPTP